MMEIRAKARRLKQRHDLKLVIVDYMQLMSSGKRVESRQLEVSEFSRQMKLLAKELEVPVVALSQLNRGPEQRTDKKPMLSDLRESGSLEQDADMVILLHREDMYNQASERAGEADLIVAKHRNGQTKPVTVVFQGHYSRFVDMQH
jgi:replicative DNA helicase